MLQAELEKEIVHIRKDLDFIKNILSENFELSDSAKSDLIKSRSTPESEYVDFVISLMGN